MALSCPGIHSHSFIYRCTAIKHITRRGSAEGHSHRTYSRPTPLFKSLWIQRFVYTPDAMLPLGHEAALQGARTNPNCLFSYERATIRTTWQGRDYAWQLYGGCTHSSLKNFLAETIRNFSYEIMFLIHQDLHQEETVRLGVIKIFDRWQTFVEARDVKYVCPAPPRV